MYRCRDLGQGLMWGVELMLWLRHFSELWRQAKWVNNKDATQAFVKLISPVCRLAIFHSAETFLAKAGSAKNWRAPAGKFLSVGNCSEPSNLWKLIKFSPCTCHSRFRLTAVNYFYLKGTWPCIHIAAKWVLEHFFLLPAIKVTEPLPKFYVQIAEDSCCNNRRKCRASMLSNTWTTAEMLPLSIARMILKKKKHGNFNLVLLMSMWKIWMRCTSPCSFTSNFFMWFVK